MHRGFFLPVKAFPPAPNGPGTGGGRCHATYLCGERFNSRPPWGGRQFDVDDESYKAIFQSTPSARRATQKSKSDINNYLLFQSTPSARRATRHPRCCFDLTHISIHALREEGDMLSMAWTHLPLDFNPRPPRGGRPHPQRWSGHPELISIHALREEGDWSGVRDRMALSDFNPRPPRGGRRSSVLHFAGRKAISIHALREEGDLTPDTLQQLDQNFNPRPPRGGRRPAPHAAAGCCRYFNPRPPRGGRPVNFSAVGNLELFQSTPSARRATPLIRIYSPDNKISIHALREEGDRH